MTCTAKTQQARSLKGGMLVTLMNRYPVRILAGTSNDLKEHFRETP